MRRNEECFRSYLETPLRLACLSQFPLPPTTPTPYNRIFGRAVNGLALRCRSVLCSVMRHPASVDLYSVFAPHVVTHSCNIVIHGVPTVVNSRGTRDVVIQMDDSPCMFLCTLLLFIHSHPEKFVSLSGSDSHTYTHNQPRGKQTNNTPKSKYPALSNHPIPYILYTSTNCLCF